MKRRAVRRDLSLSARMLIVLVMLIAVAVGGIVGAVGLLMLVSGIWVVYGLLVAYAVLFLAVVQYRSAATTMLRAVRARELLEHEEPELQASISRLAALADALPPRIAVARLDRPNSFTVGVRSRKTTIVVSRGLLELLSPAELDAVLAHELAHVLNRDAAVMSAASLPRTIGLTIMAPASEVGVLWTFIWFLGIPLWMVGSLLTLALSRYREFVADRGSALLTGAPEQLMSALQKLASPGGEIPHEDLRRLGAVEALCIVPNRRVIVAALADHPPLEKRLAALAEIAREMGRPV
ncbi:MAG TPA: M48 family metalloprotease [Gaiellaceae bacterium]|jgi:heat shock protein HtpX